jgi:PAS domain S-box-containing protein
MAAKKFKLLFVSAGDASRSRMAAGFARAKKRRDVEIRSASLTSRDSDPVADAVMLGLGVDMAGETAYLLPEAAGYNCDVVVSLCCSASEKCRTLPGNPIHLHWEVCGVEIQGLDDSGRLAAYQNLAKAMRDRVDELFDHGYLSALLNARAQANLILDHLSDGVIVHDLQRRILVFNQAAERITGYRCEDVVNQDCHEVMAGGLCGGKCSFCDNSPILEADGMREVEVATASGERRRIEMNLTYIKDQDGRASAVMACFRDITREQQLARRLGEIEHFAGIIGRDPKMLALFDLIPELAESMAPVLIQGESGTGKELIAAALHNEGPRGTQSFVPVNCGALPEGLLESELFGHVRGAFTGAIRDKKGRFELADGGTIFLDEIGDISAAMQVKLLRVLQEGCFERVGSEKTIKVNVRVISATNKVLSKEMAEGRFREDLYYRLSVVPLTVPPLRDRRNDIPLLANHFLARFSDKPGRKTVEFSNSAMDLMMSYAWPGNVRELQNWIQFALIKCKGDNINMEHLPPVALAPMKGGAVSKGGNEVREGQSGKFKLDEGLVRDALERSRGNKVEAARLLGVSRATLYRFIDSQEP